ncbi:MAG TPA: CFI-box-CTERM domain-containing protein [Nitrosopumilaceae archaeon]|nr:CFI-box-CTERM domain-containing protein [Nitrosopumilaceae archaeon]
MNKFFIISLILFLGFLTQPIFAQNEVTIGPQQKNFEISTEHSTYHYSYKEGHENIRIFLRIPDILPNEKIVIKSVYSRGPHTFIDTYQTCGDIISKNCFTKVDENLYVAESKRQYGDLFGQWTLDAKYRDQHATTTFDLTTLNAFELDAAKEEYVLKDLRETGLELVFLGSKISNQTTLKLEIFKITDNKQKSVFEHNVDVETVSQPPYFNRLPITFSKVPFSVGKYNITATWGELFGSDTFEIVDTEIVNQVPQKNGCLIATAAFGSELSPQVQILREFRDSKVLSTISGTSFLQVFNAWYYSFSPAIANLETQNPLLQIVIRNGLYPLLGILEVSQIPTVLGGEIGIIATGFIASTLIGTVYMWPISIRFDFSRFFKQTVFVIITSVGLISCGLVFTNNTLLLISTVVFVLASLTFGISLSSKVLYKIKSKNKKVAN